METFNSLLEREIKPGYEAHKLHHYTTMMGLSSILRKGYIEARESKGDADFGDMIKNHKVVSFLDGDYDNELEQFYSCNDQGKTLEGLTQHLGLHMKTVCALIEVDLDKLPEDDEVELLETITWSAFKEVDRWNDDVYDGDEYYHNIKALYETKMEFYNNKNYNSDQLKAALKERGVSEDFIKNSRFRRDCEFYSSGDPFPDYCQRSLKNAMDHAEGSRGVKLEKMSDTEIAEMKKAIEDVDVRTVYRMLRRKGIPAKWFDEIKERKPGGWLGEAEGYYWSKSNAAGSLIRYVFSAMQRSKKPFFGPTFEMRIPNNIPLTADNCKIYIFKNIIQKDIDKERVEKVLEYNNSHKCIPLQVLEAGDRIEQ